MKNSNTSVGRKAGRPLSFDRDAALREAMLLFWKHGYEATSLADLTACMGITPPSIYTAFGDKKRLFLESVNLYMSGPVTSKTIINNAETSRDAAKGLLRGSVIGFTGRDTPQGCLLATSVISCSAEASDIQSELASIRRGIELSLKKKIEKDILTGKLPSKTASGDLAAHVMAVIQGMSTLARDGATREKLMRVAEVAMLAWPK